MTFVPNGGTTDINDLAVKVMLTGTGAIIGDTIRLYNSLTLVGTKVLDTTDITNGFTIIDVLDVFDAAYDFNATFTNSAGTSARSSTYIVTVDTGVNPPPPPPDPPPGGDLIFNEDFDALDLKSAGNPSGRWMPLDFWQGISSGGYEDFAGKDTWNINPGGGVPFSSHNPFSVSGSVLTITSSRRPSDLTAAIESSMAGQGIPPPTPNWVGGMLITNPDVVQFLYGYFEARIRWPTPGKGMFPAWWLYNAKGGPKTSAEIDIFEIFGNAGNLYHTSIHGGASYEVGTGFTTDTNNWHTYGLDWTATHLNFYRDRVLVGSVTGADAAWFNVPMGLRINFAMNAPWFASTLKSDGGTPSPMGMEVDFVNVYRTIPF